MTIPLLFKALQERDNT